MYPCKLSLFRGYFLKDSFERVSIYDDTNDLYERLVFSAAVKPDWKKNTSAVRETSVSWRNEGTIRGPSYAPQYYSAVMIRGVSGDSQLCPHDAERRLGMRLKLLLFF